MSDSSIQFFIEDLPDFSFLQREENHNWLLAVVLEEGESLKSVSFIFCSDEYLLDINKQYLQHDYYTDIITFPLHDDGEKIEADIFISIDRVAENASKLEQKFEQELARVMVHGLLHLLGYGDGTDTEKKAMREREDFYLAKKGKTMI